MTSERITIEVKDLLPPKKAALYLGVTTMTLWRWRRDGIISAIMLDRPYFHINELNRVKALKDSGGGVTRPLTYAQKSLKIEENHITP